ncbi:MAG: hypothetical protein E6G62_09770 [Actinobacteria bacterium]|nr:MAG: hypothetical protein E6G62_09770 [Actinomycetota bacterium]
MGEEAGRQQSADRADGLHQLPERHRIRRSGRSEDHWHDQLVPRAAPQSRQHGHRRQSRHASREGALGVQSRLRMSHSSGIAALAADERGAVLATFALFAPVAILLAALAMDSGNWFLHKRHLQLQADAGALAAAQAFQPCSNSAIEAAAHQYSGFSGSPVYNAQIGGTLAGNVHELINSQTYYNQPTRVD